ncbi:MAG TPA: DUF3616 domain-containing protein [Adhaeribacter sp.]|nr:DUF3616 domain-containing protein [Adhaeribacter sp.]
MKKHEVTLEFKEKLSLNEDGKHVRDGLSSALLLEDSLFVACDERASLERLTRTGNHTFGHQKHYDLHEFLDLPEGPCEIDIEGTGYFGHYLWLIGSHSLVRKKPKKSKSPEEQINRLARVKEDPSRYLLARIPLVKDKESGKYELHKECPHPDQKNKTLKAAQLIKVGRQNELMALLAKDVHLKPFLEIPGKDNGFDIEGLALGGSKIFIGLRGPVLRGWAMILEVEIEETKSGRFKFKPIGEKGAMYKKHFLHLEGMGIRELRTVKDDLLILAGPTMDLDGTISVYRWKNALKLEKAAIVHRKELERLFDVPHGQGKTSGQDKAEGMALWDDHHVLIVFDSPADKRKTDGNSVIADLFKL